MAGPWEQYAQPAKPTAPDARTARYGAATPEAAQGALQAAEQAFLRRLENVPNEKRLKALQRFHADPRMATLRKSAGLVPVSTREEDIRALARQNVESGDRKYKEYTGREMDPRASSLASGASAGFLFNAAPRLEAGVNFIGDLISGQETPDYGREFDIIQAQNEYRTSRAPGASLLGNVVGGLSGGGIVAKGAQKLGAGLAASGARPAQLAGKAIQEAVTFRKGQKLANTARLVGTSAAGGGAQALGEGKDILEGAKYGAAGGLALGAGSAIARGTGKLVREFTRPVARDIGKAVREVVSEAPEELAKRQAALTKEIGAEAPLISVLKEKDFKAVGERLLKKSDAANEVAKEQTGTYIRNFMDRMLKHVNTAGKASGAKFTAVGDLAELRGTTADDLMRPVADKMVDLTQIPLDEIEKQSAREIGTRIKGLASRIRNAFDDIDPEQARQAGLDASDLANARKLASQWGLGGAVDATVKEVDGLRRALNAAAKSSDNSNPANSLAYRSAAKSIGDFVGQTYDEYGKMIETYAKHSRMIEGFEAARDGKRISDLVNNQSRANLRTPEGRVGMKAGELYRLREAATARPTKAIGLARDLASKGALTRPASLTPDAAQPGTVTENLGDAAASNLAKTSEAENQVLNRMLDSEKVDVLARNETAGALSPGDLIRGAFLSRAMPITQATWLTKMLNKLPSGFSEKVAKNMTEMLYSQDPAQVQKALNAMSKVGLTERVVGDMLRSSFPKSLVAGQIAGTSDNVSEPGAPAPLTDPMDEPDGELGPWDGYGGGESGGESGSESPYAAQLEEINQTEDPEFLDLIERVQKQESGGDQSARSPVGAVGVMQVMPETAQEAAELAGLPWDEDAYYNDPAYNKMLGIAYLREMLDQNDGDVARALIAYNAGPGALKEILAGRKQLPNETRDYLQRIL